MSWITEGMRGIVGTVMREAVSHPIALSDIRKWAIAVRWPGETAAPVLGRGLCRAVRRHRRARRLQPLRLVDGPAHARGRAGLHDRVPRVRAGVETPEYKAILLTEIRARHGAPMRPGDVIRCVWKITGYMEREGRMGLMLYTTLSQEMTNQRGEWVRTVDSVFARY